MHIYYVFHFIFNLFGTPIHSVQCIHAYTRVPYKLLHLFSNQSVNMLGYIIAWNELMLTLYYSYVIREEVRQMAIEKKARY